MNRSTPTNALTASQRIGLNLTGLFVSIGVVWLAYVYMIKPALQQREDLIAQQSRLEIVEQSHPHVIRSHQKIDSEVTSCSHQVDSLMNRIGRRRQADKSLQTITDCANRSNTTIISMQPAPSRQGELSMIQTARVSLRCDYASLCKFLSLLHASGEPVWVAEIEIKCGSGEGSLPGYGVRKADLTFHIPHSLRTELLDRLPDPLNVVNRPQSTVPEA